MKILPLDEDSWCTSRDRRVADKVNEIIKIINNLPDVPETAGDCTNCGAPIKSCTCIPGQVLRSKQSLKEVATDG